MNLEDKLREILQTPHIDSLGATVMSFPTNKTLEQIKQAFADAKYSEPWDGATRIRSFELNKGREYMLGAEWYDRFSTALIGYECLPVDVGSVNWDAGNVMRAAKKAAGLDD